MDTRMIMVITLVATSALTCLLIVGQAEESQPTLVLGEETQVVVTPSSSPTSEFTPTPSPSPTPTPSLTPTPTPTTTPTPTPKPSPTPKAQPLFTSEQIYGFTQEFGGQYGTDPNVLRHLALCESGFNPMAKNYIYAGLFQYSASTWSNYRKQMGEDADPDLRYNAREAVKTTAYLLSRGKGHNWPNCMP